MGNISGSKETDSSVKETNEALNNRVSVEENPPEPPRAPSCVDPNKLKEHVQNKLNNEEATE